MNVPRIAVGLELVDDEGAEVVVRTINEVKETATLETSDGDSYSMSLRDLRSKLRDGEFACIDDDEPPDDPDEDEDEDEDEDDDAP